MQDDGLPSLPGAAVWNGSKLDGRFKARLSDYKIIIFENLVTQIEIRFIKRNDTFRYVFLLSQKLSLQFSAQHFLVYINLYNPLIYKHLNY